MKTAPKEVGQKFNKQRNGRDKYSYATVSTQTAWCFRNEKWDQYTVVTERQNSVSVKVHRLIHTCINHMHRF